LKEIGGCASTNQLINSTILKVPPHGGFNSPDLIHERKRNHLNRESPLLGNTTKKNRNRRINQPGFAGSHQKLTAKSKDSSTIDLIINEF
jgi:hypothetical protein